MTASLLPGMNSYFSITVAIPTVLPAFNSIVGPDPGSVLHRWSQSDLGVLERANQDIAFHESVTFVKQIVENGKPISKVSSDSGASASWLQRSVTQN